MDIGNIPPSPVAQPHRLSLSFDASLDTVEGILAMTQEWAIQEGIARDDVLSLRLVLDELLSNICLHAGQHGQTGKVALHLEFLAQPAAPTAQPPSRPRETSPQPLRAPQGVVHIVLRDTGPPFNPLAYEPEPVSGIRDTPTGGRGLTLVRLLTTRAAYQCEGGSNRLSLDLPLDGHPATHGDPRRTTTPTAATGNFRDRLRARWYANLALRQTVVFTLCAVALIWGAMILYSLEVSRERAVGAATLASQAMHTQSVISSTFLDRVGGGLESVAAVARRLPGIETLLADPDALVRELQKNAGLRSLVAELPVLGIVVGSGGRTWLYRMHDGQENRQRMKQDLASLVAPAGATSVWQSLLLSFQDNAPHAAMFYGAPLAPSGNPADGWIGTIITMPWIAGTLRGLAGFKQAVPFYLDHTGQYIIYPVGRRLGDGPQSLSEEAREHDAPGLAVVEKTILAGGKGVIQLRAVLGGDGTPWPLPWDGPTSLAYAPMRQPGWYLALLVSSEELGNAPQKLPAAFFLMAILGPVCIGCVTWFVTSRTLRPLHELAGALERFGSGDMDAPFPKMRLADEIGRMLATFERVRVTLRVSLRNLVNSAAAQQRIHNELAMARNIQESMLPAVFPSLSWARIHAGIDMCREVCGDLYDSFVPDPEDPSRICCVIGDVCGKGVPAAIIMSRAMSLAHSFLLSGLSPAATLARLNDALLRRDNSSMFVTMLVGILERDGTFSWASAGHPPPLPGPVPEGAGFSPAPAECLPWPGELVLGVRSGESYSTFHLRLKPGQSLLLYTDGADEALGPPPAGDLPKAGDGELYGDTRLAASFDHACRNAPPEEPRDIVEQLRADLDRHMAGRPPADDISLLVLTRTRHAGDKT